MKKQDISYNVKWTIWKEIEMRKQNIMDKIEKEWRRYKADIKALAAEVADDYNGDAEELYEAWTDLGNNAVLEDFVNNYLEVAGIAECMYNLEDVIRNAEYCWK